MDASVQVLMQWFVIVFDESAAYDLSRMYHL